MRDSNRRRNKRGKSKIRERRRERRNNALERTAVFYAPIVLEAKRTRERNHPVCRDEIPTKVCSRRPSFTVQSDERDNRGCGNFAFMAATVAS